VVRVNKVTFAANNIATTKGLQFGLEQLFNDRLLFIIASRFDPEVDGIAR